MMVWHALPRMNHRQDPMPRSSGSIAELCDLLRNRSLPCDSGKRDEYRCASRRSFSRAAATSASRLYFLAGKHEAITGARKEFWTACAISGASLIHERSAEMPRANAVFSASRISAEVRPASSLFLGAYFLFRSAGGFFLGRTFVAAMMFCARFADETLVEKG